MEGIAINFDIRRVDNDTAIKFLKSVPMKYRKSVFVRDNCVWYGSFVNDRLVSVCGATDAGKYVKMSTALTLPEYRRKGHSLAVQQRLIQDFHGKELHAWCIPDSVQLNVQLGFHKVRTLKNGTTYMIRDGSEKNEDD